MKWYMIEDCTRSRSAVFETELNVTTQEEAIAEARAYYDSLSRHDQQAREEMYIGRAETCEEGGVDYETLIDVYDIKPRG